MGDWYLYVVIIITLGFSAFFSGAEITFNSANKLRLKKAAENGSKISAMALDMAENFTTSLSAILIGNNLVNIASSVASTYIFMHIFSKLGLSMGLASLVSTVVMTVIILIFGEITPKIIGRKLADKLITVLVWPVKIITWLLFVPVGIVMTLIRFLSRIWGKDATGDEPTVSGDELVTLIDTVEEEGVIDEDRSELLQSTIEFQATTAGEIITPRTELTAIDIDDERGEQLAIIEDSHFTRIPVYEDTIDNIIGILNLNYFYKAMIEDLNVDIRSMLIEPYFIHKTKKLPAILSEMKERKQHIAVVLDEYGGTLGIVTMEDLLEEIVGDIWDESDEVAPDVIQTGKNTYDIEGDMLIDDFFDIIEFKDSEFSSECFTMSGWITELLDSDPHVGDSCIYKNLYLIVTEMEDLIVKKLTVIVSADEDDEDEEE